MEQVTGHAGARDGHDQEDPAYECGDRGETDHQRGEEPPDASRREVRRAPLSRLVKTPDPPLRDHGSCEPAEEAAEEVKTEHSMSDIEAST